MRLITWNINSVRLRLPLLLRLIDEAQPDLVLLQETKADDSVFPVDALEQRGFVHRHIHGMKAYNGVAILSRLPFADRAIRHWCDREDCRHVAVQVLNGPEVHSVYVPSGGDVPDPAVNPKFEHKLRFLEEMAGWWLSARSAERPMVLAGDLNIAPLEHDVWSHKEMQTVVSHTPVEVEILERLRTGLGWVDVGRRFVPAEEKLYTWWSYRAKDWRSSDRGRRLDHVWVTKPLEPFLAGYTVIKEARGWEPRPSDHVPVMVDLRL